MNKLDTRYKLEEAKYFLEELKKRSKWEQFTIALFYLSAFLTAWKSVLDVLLYDFAEFFNIGLDRNDRITIKEFKLARKILKLNEADPFIEWFDKKKGILTNNQLFRIRNIFVHRGKPPISYGIYVTDSLISGSVILYTDAPMSGITISYEDEDFPVIRPSELPIAEYPEGIIIGQKKFNLSEIVEMCNEVYLDMEKIVKEAEEKFIIDLSSY